MAIADDHQIIIDGINVVLNTCKSIHVIATANSGNELIDILRTETCDIAIIDIRMPGLNGVETTRVIKKEYPHIGILVLSGYNDKKLILEMVEAGASGYLFKNTNAKELLNAITQVAQGKWYFSKTISFTLSDEQEPQKHDKKENVIDLLTKRELEILKLVVDGVMNIGIAEVLSISPYTVDSHRKNINKKLNVNNIAGLVKFAFQNKLLN